MPRSRVDARFAALARRRPDLDSQHFGLALNVTAPEHACARPGPAPARPGPIGFAVPARLLARAVDRNALKRVAREAWRAAPWPRGEAPELAMLKLRRVDARWRATTRGALKRLWRAELDQLFARASLGAAGPAGPAGVRAPRSRGDTRPPGGARR